MILGDKMRKKKNEKKKIIILTSILIVILLALVIMLDDSRKLTKPEIIIKDAVFAFSNFISQPLFIIKDKIFATSKTNYQTEVKEIENIGTDNEILKENIELKSLLELNNTLSERKHINATVINRNIDYWFNELTVDKGSSDGIKEGMAVINNHGLIGKIVKVSKNTSTVKLLTDENMVNKISVKIEYEDRFVYGLLTDYQDDTFIINGISNNINIDEGAKVTTSGLTDSFPSGVLIGFVSKVTTDNFDLAKTLKVKSDIDFNDIYYVTILDREAGNND